MRVVETGAPGNQWVRTMLYASGENLYIVFLAMVGTTVFWTSSDNRLQLCETGE
jgi:hypothetical protein